MPDFKKLTRTQILAIALVAVVVMWQGSGYVSKTLFGPFHSARERLAKLKTDVEKKQFEADTLDFARARLAGWKARSLPPDQPNAVTSKKPEALSLKAHIHYQEWITDLVMMAGFDNPSIRPTGRGVGKNGNSNVYFSMGVQIEGDATYGQLCTFLDHFYRTNLLHRIAKLDVDSRESAGDPLMRVTIIAEALALADVQPRRSLFTETTLAKPLSTAATECEVASSAAFPRKAPFRIRIGSEFLNVTAMNGNTWTVTRAVERTHTGDYPKDERVEFTPLNLTFPSQDAEQFRAVLAANPFIKPPPPHEYKVKIGPLAEQAFTRGSNLEYTVPVTDYDPTLGKPEFTITSGAPPGLRLDRGTGKISWKPADDQPAGQFPMKLEVRHPNAPEGKRDAELTVVFREPNSAPEAKVSSPPIAYIGREWKYKIDLADKETVGEKLSVKLGDGAPQGLSVAPGGELRWTPPESLKPGNFNVPVTITDDGVPPQTVTITLPLKLEEDAAQFTILAGIVSVNDQWQAWLRNQLYENKNTYLGVGDSLNIGDVSGTVSEIKPKYVLIKQGEKTLRLDLGRNLREMEPVSATAQVSSDAASQARRSP